MNPDFLDMVADWGREKFPDLLIEETINSLPVKFYIAEGSIRKWVASVQSYPREISAWNPSNREDYIEHLSLHDSQIFVKLEAFIKRSMKEKDV